MYTMIGTQLNLAFPVSTLSHFKAHSTKQHYGAAKRVLRYLCHTRNYGIVYGGNKITMEGFSDSDWTNDKDGQRSINKYVFKICVGAITWKSRKQSLVALSSTEAEYVGYSEAAKEVI